MTTNRPRQEFTMSNSQSSANYLEAASLKQIARDQGIFYPVNVAELQLIIAYAKKVGATVRTMGAHHSPSTAIFSNNEQQICLQLAGEFKSVHAILPNESQDHAEVTVGAGCYLGKNPQDKNSTWENSFNYQIDQQGYALPILGGISHQVIAGFLQTGSSGGSGEHGIADVVEEIELVNGEGKLCHFKKGEDEFNAAMVAVGLFGIVTKVKFNLPKRYLVEGLEENKEVKDSVLAKDENGKYTSLRDKLFSTEYMHVNWFPQHGVNRTMQWTGKAVDASLPLVPYEHPLKSSVLNVLAALVLSMTNILDKVGSTNEIMQKIKDALLKPFVNLEDKKTFRDVWYKALPIDDQADVDSLIKTFFSEMWFPKDQLDEVMARLEKLFREQPQTIGNFIVEFYAAKKSPYWLSPSHADDAFRVDLYWWAHNLGNAHDYFAPIWAALLSVPGMCFHWGEKYAKAGPKIWRCDI